MRDIRVAAAMMRSVVGDKTGNLERLERLTRKGREQGADLVVFPEACLTGYTVRESMAHLAETVPGPLTDAISGMAARLGAVILAGLVEAGDNGGCYLTQVMAGPEGVIESYRKTHLGPLEKERFSAGDRLCVFAHDSVSYGIQLCYEGHFPEMSLAQALAGAEVVLLPHASPREMPEQKLKRWLRYMPARAYDNTFFLVSCNQVGDNGGGLSFAGAALIAGPKGEILAQAAGEEEQVIWADLKAEELRAVKEGRMGYFLPLRQPDIYEIK